jgi:uncharacterized membrane protein
VAIVNVLRRFWTNLFPPARRRVRIRDAAPLVLFIALFSAVWVSLEWSHTLMFARPQSLVWLNLCPWIWWLSMAGYAGLGRTRSQFALFTRMTIIGLFVMLLSEPRMVRTQDVMSVVYAVDLSDSIGDSATTSALKFVVQTATAKPKSDLAGMIVFGREATVELPPQTSFPFEAINSQVDRDATNLEQTLSLAAALIREENQGRIVLISDGTATEGNLHRVLDELKVRGIAVDFLPVQYNYSNEVWLERLELPPSAKIGQPFDAVMVLSSLNSGEGKLVLKQNGTPIREEQVKFAAGKNRFSFPVTLTEPGYYDYSATIIVPRSQDHLLQNNTVINDLFLEGEGRVLVVIDPDGPVDTQKVPIDSKYLVAAIRKSKRIAEVRAADDLPRDPAALLPYDAILFVNVGTDLFDAVQMKTVHDAIYDQGIGFAMIGGKNSFGAGGYHKTLIEDALPVSMDVSQKKILPKGALVIILHTCEFPEGNTWAKRITKQAIKVLSPRDEVGVVDYEGREKWVFEITAADDYEGMSTKINAAAPGDMPAFQGTMKMGLEGLKKNKAATKHMIIISDGDPPPPTEELIKDFIANEVSVSMVAIEPHGGREISTMRAISNVTRGKYYFPASPDELPSIFIKEARTLRRNMVQEMDFTPEVQYVSPILKGLDALPPLHGYVLTTAKPSAQLILRAPPDNSESPEVDPILAVWRYGLGATAAFTSNFSPSWGADWLEWSQFQPFVQQLLTEIARVRKEGYLRMSTYTSGGEGTIVVEDFQPNEGFLEVQARISGPHGKSQQVPLKQVGPRRYQATVSLWGAGRYHVSAVGAGDGRKENCFGRLIVSYSPEYLRFRSSPQAIDEIVKRTGGQLLTKQSTADDIYLTNRRPQRSSQPIFDNLLMLLACLIPIDVALRRIQIDWLLIRGWFTSKRRLKAESTATMSALLLRRQVVKSEIETRRGTPATSDTRAKPPDRPVINRTDTVVDQTNAQSEKADSKSQPSAASEIETGTTGRLKALKRQREAEKKLDEETPE